MFNLLVECVSTLLSAHKIAQHSPLGYCKQCCGCWYPQTAGIEMCIDHHLNSSITNVVHVATYLPVSTPFAECLPLLLIINLLRCTRPFAFPERSGLSTLSGISNDAKYVFEILSHSIFNWKMSYALIRRNVTRRISWSSHRDTTGLTTRVGHWGTNGVPHGTFIVGNKICAAAEWYSPWWSTRLLQLQPCL